MSQPVGQQPFPYPKYEGSTAKMGIETVQISAGGPAFPKTLVVEEHADRLGAALLAIERLG
jgi:hypothetical protein